MLIKKMGKKGKSLIMFSVIVFSLLPLQSRAAGASLYLSPGSGTFHVGSTFDVSVFINTGNENINAVEVNIKFDPQKLQVTSPTGGKSFIEVWVAQPTYSNTNGTMRFIGGVPSPGVKTSSGLVSTVTFRAISPGETSVSFLESSKVLRNDPEGTNILTSLSRGSYNLVIPPPEGPEIFSPTHPDQNAWYKNNNPTFSWEKEDGVIAFSYTLDNDPLGFPDSVAEGDFNSVSFSDLEDGIWYFHVKAKKAGVWGGVSHYVVKLDQTSPAIFKPTVDPEEKTIERQPLISFITTDALSGTSHYELKYIDITPDREVEETGFFVEVVSPYKLPSLEIGKYLVVVRAYDNSGNWREQTITIEIFPDGFYFSGKGIHYRQFLVPWWMILLILLLLILLVVFFRWKKEKDLLEKEKASFNKLESHKEEIAKDVKAVNLESHDKNVEK